MYEISLDEVISHAKEIMFRDGKHVPALIVEGGKKLIISPIPNMPETHGERISLLRFLGEEAVKTGEIGPLQQVFIIAEEWLSLGNKSKSVKMQSGPEANRHEVLVISGWQIKERKRHRRLFEVLRSRDRKVVGLEELLPEEKRKDQVIKTPLVEAFVYGFKSASQTKYN